MRVRLIGAQRNFTLLLISRPATSEERQRREAWLLLCCLEMSWKRSGVASLEQCAGALNVHNLSQVRFVHVHAHSICAVFQQWQAEGDRSGYRRFHGVRLEFPEAHANGSFDFHALLVFCSAFLERRVSTYTRTFQMFKEMTSGPNQLHVSRSDVSVGTSDLLRMPTGGVTAKGLKHNIEVGIYFMVAWLRGDSYKLTV